MPNPDVKSNTVTVDVIVTIPADIARQFGLNNEQISRRLLEQATVEGYRSRQLSRGQVSQMLGMNWTETETFLSLNHCDRHYDIEDLEEDRRNLEKILGPS
ncbi:MAG TPA: UPF0175 family protein [Verrucomicrobiae bacterium]|jgi:predicted HTH domain antitoxin